MTVQYEPMKCRLCGFLISPKVTQVEKPKSASCYDDCNYQCPNLNCRVGYSNATLERDRKAIFQDYLLNVPAEPFGLRSDLPYVLDNALNVRNRANKKLKIAFSRSEDALTWVTFYYLNQRKEVLQALDGSSNDQYRLLLWGTELPKGDEAIRKEIVSILENELGENPRSLSEPDVIVVSDASVYVVEVKYGSPNDVNKTNPESHWDRYTKNREHLFSVPLNEVREKGFYELTRNWVFGNLLASKLGRSLSLINLAPNNCRSSSDSFLSTINVAEHDYRFLSWSDFVAGFQKPLDGWYESYMTAAFNNGSVEG